MSLVFIRFACSQFFYRCCLVNLIRPAVKPVSSLCNRSARTGTLIPKLTVDNRFQWWSPAEGTLVKPCCVCTEILFLTMPNPIHFRKFILAFLPLSQTKRACALATEFLLFLSSVSLDYPCVFALDLFFFISGTNSASTAQASSAKSTYSKFIFSLFANLNAAPLPRRIPLFLSLQLNKIPAAVDSSGISAARRKGDIWSCWIATLRRRRTMSTSY